MAIHTRIPSSIPESGGTTGSAWTCDEATVTPTGNEGLTTGQAWSYDENGDLVLNGNADISGDDCWEYDGNGDATPL
jgi:hypothetical protein